MTTERNIAKQMFRSLSGGLMSFKLLKEKCDKLGTDERCPVRRFPGWALLWGDFKRCHSQCGSGNCAMSVQWWR